MDGNIVSLDGDLSQIRIIVRVWLIALQELEKLGLAEVGLGELNGRSHTIAQTADDRFSNPIGHLSLHQSTKSTTNVLLQLVNKHSCPSC